MQQRVRSCSLGRLQSSDIVLKIQLLFAGSATTHAADRSHLICLQGVLLPWIATSSWTSDYLQPVLLAGLHMLKTAQDKSAQERDAQDKSAQERDAQDKFAHIDYELMVHRYSLSLAHHQGCASEGPKSVVSASMCRHILGQALSLLSAYLKQGYPMQVCVLSYSAQAPMLAFYQ